MPILLNNCRARDHTRLYPSTGDSIAFYDLGSTGHQAALAVNLPRGAECIVASYENAGTVRFDWWSFSHEEIRQCEGEDLRVFFGTRTRSETMPKARAAEIRPYAAFFDRRGAFRRTSVIGLS